MIDWKNILTQRFAVLFFLLALVFYFIFSNHKPAIFNHHVYLADAILHGSFEINNPPVHHNDVITFNGKNYSIYGITPALIMLPLVFFSGLKADEAKIAILIGAINVYFIWKLLTYLDIKNNIKIWLTLFFTFGTLNFFSAVHNQTWWFVYLVVEFFILISVLEIFSKRRYWLVGLCLGLAFLTRIEAIFGFLLPLVLINRKKVDFKQTLLLFFGFAPSLLGFLIYNHLRFDDFLETGYRIFVMSEAYYFRDLNSYGLFSIHYLPYNFYVYFLKGPDLVSHFPYLSPPWIGMSIFFVSPALLLIVRASYKDLIVKTSLLIVVLMSLPSLLYYLPGWTEFGWKHSVMFLPFLIILVACGAKTKFDRLSIFLIILSIISNLWGVLWWKLGGWFY